MKWLQKCEAKLSRYAIKNLMMYIIMLYAVGVIVFLVNPVIYYTYMALDFSRVLKGEVWRLVTFLMMPPSVSNIFFMALSCYIYWMLGTSVENAWGPFRFNLYYFGGVFSTILANLILYLIFYKSDLARYQNMVFFLDTTFINFSLFLAFALTFPDVQFYLFFVIPIKAKILGLIELLVYVVMFIQGDLGLRIAIGVSLLNFLIFFLLTRNLKRFTPGEIKRRSSFKREARVLPGSARHRCAVCGKTEKDGEDLEFRFCSRCEGNREYCQEHLYTHIHVTKNQPISLSGNKDADFGLPRSTQEKKPEDTGSGEDWV